MVEKKTFMKWVVALVAALALVVVVVLVSVQNENIKDFSQGDQTQESTNSTESKIDLTYEEYLAMTKEDRQAFFESFESMDEFLIWLDAAKEAYQSSKNDNAIDGDKPIDLEDLLG